MTDLYRFGASPGTQSPKRRYLNPGFTLIELLVVIAIIAVLVGHIVAGCSAGPRSRPQNPVPESTQATCSRDS